MGKNCLKCIHYSIIFFQCVCSSINRPFLTKITIVLKIPEILFTGSTRLYKTAEKNIYYYTRVKIMSLLFNRIEQCCAAHIVHTCQQY